MTAGSRATFVISWSQTEADGLRAVSPSAIVTGATWRWLGEAVRVDAPGNILLLEGAQGEADVRRRAALMVQRLIGTAVGQENASGDIGAEPDTLPDQSFVLGDGLRSWTATLLPVAGGRGHLAMFLGEMPPAGRDLWVIRSRIAPAAPDRSTGGVICFTPGTRIMTPTGPERVENLHPGDLVQTRDNGAQEVLWTGSRRMTGARLYAMPHLRPVRLREGALGSGRPDGDLVVSPQHRMLVSGPAARALFNTDEVLVAAGDLVNDHSVLVDPGLREVTYHHLLLERHEIVFANGLETESFHPSAADPDSLDQGDRARLTALMPGLAADPMCYGDFARRMLSSPEAALLCHEGAI
ncbi:Hint domain-containing protein [Pseudogemmobacter humi]|uniref:Hedgehog/Intein (Hint) domain-containing protein n=1 Tax=Pseudogemmobacter humi TaxID=2483812 RepID=A0A3P5XET5_9RHOB|nr:Hint domain-containing protein [Pseudogemmobacter humi]VDC26064.1 hypothetical protein XINFAN_01552 [Pseudogemmobacter humi]